MLVSAVMKQTNNGKVARFGDPRLPERFWKNVEPCATGDCWLWVGTTTEKGYGRVYIDGRTSASHRIAYERLCSPVPDGLVIDHLCRVRNCVNPAHMEPVTSRTNVLRGESSMARKARQTHCKRGHPFSAENTYASRGGQGRKCRTCRARARPGFEGRTGETSKGDDNG